METIGWCIGILVAVLLIPFIFPLVDLYIDWVDGITDKLGHGIYKRYDHISPQKRK